MSRTAGPQTSGAVFGRYVLVERLGHGKAHELWIAIDVDLDRKVALELLRVRAGQRGRFQARLASLASLTHRNVAAIHDSGERDGQLFFAREYVEGEGLDQWMARGPHAWQEALALMRQLGAGLEAAHEAGLVHGCSRPSRVVRGADGRVCIVDWGLSLVEHSESELAQSSEGKRSAESVELEAQTDGRVLRAKPRQDRKSSPHALRPVAYLAPEQLREGAASPRSDIFALCCMLFEALYGVLPFRMGTPLAMLEAIEAGAVVELPADELAPAWIHRAVLRGLAADPEQRYASVAELFAQLSLSPLARRRRRRLRVGLAAVVGLGVAAALTVVLRGAPGDPCAADPSLLGDTWSEARAQELRQRMTQLGEEGAAAAEIIEEGLERHTAAWLGARAQQCREQRSERSTARIEQQREACFERSRVELAALTQLDAPPGSAQLEGEQALLSAIAARPYKTLRSLGDPRRCLLTRAGEHAGYQAFPVPFELARARLLFSLMPEPPEPLARAVLRALSDHPQLRSNADIGLLRAQAMQANADEAGAQAALEQLAQLAVVTQPQLAARAWSQLARSSLEQRPVEDQEASTRRTLSLLDYARALAAQRARAHPRAARARARR